MSDRAGVDTVLNMILNTGLSATHFCYGQEGYAELAARYNSSLPMRVQKIDGLPYVMFMAQDSIKYVVVWSEEQLFAASTYSLCVFLGWISP